ncbi:MAG: Gfo/Idh/MocA family oxidoreductase, partial [Gammaproteobacteria bacterium]|nr:Gfo/Idh/MocA family oxidoreductase [Gammaproteobacteria bacterium]
MVIRVGMLGLSEGDGHPFSFSSIINGYSDSGMAESGWPGIHAYLRRRDASEFGGLNMEVTHAWTQYPDTTNTLCRAAKIPNAVADPSDLIGEVDAVIIARDDFELHREMAAPFLDVGMAVFVDKPLATNEPDLSYFAPFIHSGQLMSGSGMRFARELDEPRSTWDEYGTVRLIRGAILNEWERYGIHIIDGILGMCSARPTSVSPVLASHDSVNVRMSDGSLVQIDALGAVAPCFR